MPVKIVNTTTVPVKISEGSSGVFHVMRVINPGETFILRVHMNETYREFLLATVPENLPVGSPLTSDDVVYYSRIEIKEIKKPGGVPVWSGIPNVRRRGCAMFLRRLFKKQFVTFKICNRLTGQRVNIVEINDREPVTSQYRTIENLAPGKMISISVDPNDTHLYYRLKTEDYGEVGRRVKFDDFKFYSKIEITETSNEYIWEGISKR